MNITSNQFQAQENQNHTKKLTNDETKELRQTITDNANKFTFKISSIQANIFSAEDKFKKDYEEFQSFLNDIGYKGGSIAKLSSQGAKQLVSENGIFGVKKTSLRVANFVIQGANGDAQLLRAGKEGMLKGFKIAEKMWGESLPEISEKTMKVATELVDKALSNLGVSIFDAKA